MLVSVLVSISLLVFVSSVFVSISLLVLVSSVFVSISLLVPSVFVSISLLVLVSVLVSIPLLVFVHVDHYKLLLSFPSLLTFTSWLSSWKWLFVNYENEIRLEGMRRQITAFEKTLITGTYNSTVMTQVDPLGRPRAALSETCPRDIIAPTQTVNIKNSCSTLRQR